MILECITRCSDDFKTSKVQKSQNVPNAGRREGVSNQAKHCLNFYMSQNSLGRVGVRIIWDNVPNILFFNFAGVACIQIVLVLNKFRQFIMKPVYLQGKNV